jgi:hypothetical protein
MRPAHFFFVLCCFIICGTTACRTPTRLDVDAPQTAWEVLFRPPTSPVYGISASPDGGIFSGGGGRVYRAIPDDDYKTWSLIGDSTWRVLDVFAFSRSSVALKTAQNVTFINETQSGWKALPTVIPPSVIQTPYGAPILFDVWGRSMNDVFAVGTFGTILHFDGQEWKREINPLDTVAMDGTTRSQSTVGGVGGVGLQTFAAGYVSLERVGGQWRAIDRPEAHLGGCKSRAVAAAQLGSDGATQVVFGGGDFVPVSPCMWSTANGSIPLKAPQAYVGDAFIQGKGQADGSLLLWTYGGDVAEIVDNRISHIYRLKLQGFAGAVAVGKYLYFGGVSGDEPIIARILRR